MITEIRELKLAEGKSIFVEVEVVEVKLPTQTELSDLPLGAEPTGVLDTIGESMKIFKENIRNMAESVHESLKDLQPDKWTVEMNVGFKGTATPIPFIAGSEVKGGVKITVTWKKEEDE